MSTPSQVGLARWYDAFASADPATLTSIIAPGAVFHSPAMHRPQVGRDLVVAYLSAAKKVLGAGFIYREEWVRERDAVLLFETTVDGLEVQGVDMITWNDDGLIIDFTVMIRPLTGLQAVIERMGEELGRAMPS